MTALSQGEGDPFCLQKNGFQENALLHHSSVCFLLYIS